jgi:hypothetical protein
MEKQVKLAYGVVTDTLAKQISEQGLSFDKKAINQFQKQQTAIHTLRFGNIITDSVADKAFKRLHNRVMGHLQSMNA